ncbi:glycosyltransferase [Neolewinella antarctica]|uniref:Glycosyl transferase family 28 C-terminal domain-containing protein n=1 Tax=Neolewinella antarctica TaxID=442734 RepID=A0ABX0XF50_9BACT|nr:glycosyltransferase [Neolewinella antarctica]NJC27956.1 hypothetical protein [Neolewinella antarctica]
MPQRTLLCILDWGLGHASRCLALLDHPILAGDVVFVASSGTARAFLQRERPDLKVYELPSYAVRYPTSNMPLNVALQLPKWARVAWRERRVTAKLVQQLSIDRVVSDNRFGCYAASVPSIFLTHQLHPITNFAPASWLYRRYLRQFDEFWVPDGADRSLSGKLADPTGYANVRFLGPLSRLRPVREVKKSIGILCLLSGPEPMRGRLEKLLVKSLGDIEGQHYLIRGVPGGQQEIKTDNLTTIDFAGAKEIASLVAKAEHIVCRSGYSTLMDLAALQVATKVILIPTPGQTEQEYLARTQVQCFGGQRFQLAQKNITARAIRQILAI